MGSYSTKMLKKDIIKADTDHSENLQKLLTQRTYLQFITKHSRLGYFEC